MCTWGCHEVEGKIALKCVSKAYNIPDLLHIISLPLQAFSPRIVVLGMAQVDDMTERWMTLAERAEAHAQV